MITVS
jgi:hypothetical protein